MTNVTIEKKGNSIIKIVCDGHTNYGVEGEDIVCAALSSIPRSSRSFPGIFSRVCSSRRAYAVTEASEKRVELISATVRDRVDSAAGMLGRFSEEADRKVADALTALNGYMEMLRGLNGSFADTRKEMLSAVEEIRTAGLPAHEGEEND